MRQKLSKQALKKPKWMLVAPCVLAYPESTGYVMSSGLFRSAEEATKHHGRIMIYWPAGNLVRVPYKEPRP
jgi:hypothetical protein